MAQGFGDRLARGGNKAAFPAGSVGVTEEKFEAATKDFDSAGFLARAEAEENAARERRAERQKEAEAEHIRQDEEREARRKAEAEAEKNAEPEIEPEFSGRYPDVKEAGVSSSDTGKTESDARS